MAFCEAVARAAALFAASVSKRLAACAAVAAWAASCFAVSVGAAIGVRRVDGLSSTSASAGATAPAAATAARFSRTPSGVGVEANAALLGSVSVVVESMAERGRDKSLVASAISPPLDAAAALLLAGFKFTVAIGADAIVVAVLAAVGGDIVAGDVVTTGDATRVAVGSAGTAVTADVGGAMETDGAAAICPGVELAGGVNGGVGFSIAATGGATTAGALVEGAASSRLATLLAGAGTNGGANDVACCGNALGAGANAARPLVGGITVCACPYCTHHKAASSTHNTAANSHAIIVNFDCPGELPGGASSYTSASA